MSNTKNGTDLYANVQNWWAGLSGKAKFWGLAIAGVALLIIIGIAQSGGSSTQSGGGSPDYNSGYTFGYSAQSDPNSTQAWDMTDYTNPPLTPESECDQISQSPGYLAGVVNNSSGWEDGCIAGMNAAGS
jgi:hypothetical protein